MIPRLQRLLDNAVEAYGNVGAVLGVSVAGREPLILTSGMADRESSRPARPDDVFLIASQTKTLTALAAMGLIRRGVLGLSDSAARWVGKDLDPRITVEHLLAHQSGLGDYGETFGHPAFRWDQAFDPRTLLRLSNLRGPHFEPGAAFDYSNINSVLLALVVERAGDLPLAERLRREVAEPLEIELWFRAGEAAGPPPPRGRMLHSYLRTADGTTRAAIDTDLSWTFGTGHAAADSRGMLRLWSALAGGDLRLPASLADLTRVSRRAAYSPAFALSAGVEYGYGVEAACWGGEPVWGHPGRLHGSSSGTWADPERGVVVTVCVTGVYDTAESMLLYLLRYPGAQLYAAAFSAAYRALEEYAA